MKHRPLLLLLVLSAILSASGTASAEDGQKAAKLDTQVKVQMSYLLYLPKAYEKQDSWPLLLFLHGSGERGDDLELVKKHGPPKLISQGKEFSFIVVSHSARKSDGGSRLNSWPCLMISARITGLMKTASV